jgi:hypothetical protein
LSATAAGRFQRRLWCLGKKDWEVMPDTWGCPRIKNGGFFKKVLTGRGKKFNIILTE